MTELTPEKKKKFERWIYIFVAVIVALRFFGAYEDLKARRSTVMDATAAPDFTWHDFDGEKHPFKALKGQVVVLHFWASWCGPCREEFPALLRAADLLKNDAIFLTISGDEEERPARKFIFTAKNAAGVMPENVLYGFDPMKAIVFDLFQTAALPETFIIDPQMKMRRKLVGAQKWDDQLIDSIRNLKKTVPASAVPVPE